MSSFDVYDPPHRMTVTTDAVIFCRHPIKYCADVASVSRAILIVLTLEVGGRWSTDSLASSVLGQGQGSDPHHVQTCGTDLNKTLLECPMTLPFMPINITEDMNHKNTWISDIRIFIESVPYRTWEMTQ